MFMIEFFNIITNEIEFEEFLNEVKALNYKYGVYRNNKDIVFDDRVIDKLTWVRWNKIVNKKSTKIFYNIID